MILEFWQTFLYQPLFNVLIWIYANLTDQNLGWAIVYLTILLRLVLLPLTIKSERNKSKNTLVAKEIVRLDKDFAKDHVLKKEEIRKVLKKTQNKPLVKSCCPWYSRFGACTSLSSVFARDYWQKDSRNTVSGYRVSRTNQYVFLWHRTW